MKPKIPRWSNCTAEHYSSACARQIIKREITKLQAIGGDGLREILGDAKNIRALLGNAKYAIDYYQREFRWQTKHVTELIDDLADKFLDSYEPEHERRSDAED